MDERFQYDGKSYDELLFIHQNLDMEIRTLLRKRKVVEDLLLKNKQEQRKPPTSMFANWPE